VTRTAGLTAARRADAAAWATTDCESDHRHRHHHRHRRQWRRTSGERDSPVFSLGTRRGKRPRHDARTTPWPLDHPRSHRGHPRRGLLHRRLTPRPRTARRRPWHPSPRPWSVC